jgi:hypothetical protein
MLLSFRKEAIKMNYKAFQENDVKLMELLLEHKSSINAKFRSDMIEDVDWIVSDNFDDYDNVEQKIAGIGIYDVMGFLQDYHKNPDYERVMDWDLEDPESDWHDFQTCRAINLMKMPDMAEDPEKVWTDLEKRLQAVKENCESGKYDYYKA